MLSLKCGLGKKVKISACKGPRRGYYPGLTSMGGRSSGVEHNLAKVGVEGSNPFARSNDGDQKAAGNRGFFAFQSNSAAPTELRSAGRASASNQGLRRIQPVLRQLGCGRGNSRGA